MSARLPDLGVHDDGAIDADHGDLLAVGSRWRVADHVVPPDLLDVVLELDAEGSVVPEAVEAAVDLARLKDEAAAATEGDQLFHIHSLLRLRFARAGRFR